MMHGRTSSRNCGEDVRGLDSLTRNSSPPCSPPRGPPRSRLTQSTLRELPGKQGPAVPVRSRSESRSASPEKRRSCQTALCFSAGSFRLTHPALRKQTHVDADATLTSPMILGVVDGVSQLAQYGIDPRELPEELLSACKRLAQRQLVTGLDDKPIGMYEGPVNFLRDAFQETKQLGSLTVALAWVDNSFLLKGTPHPMVSIITVGDCQVLVLRRMRGGDLQILTKTEMQRVDGNAQTPLQLARVDSRIDPTFEERLTVDIIERGSAVQCVSAYVGDFIIMGSDGVFDNLFVDEILEICKSELPIAPSGCPLPQLVLERVARRIVQASHSKTGLTADGLIRDAPIGMGGKEDDTSVIVAEVTAWNDDQRSNWNTPSSKEKEEPVDWYKVVDIMLNLATGGIGSLCTRTVGSAWNEGYEDVDAAKGEQEEFSD